MLKASTLSELRNVHGSLAAYQEALRLEPRHAAALINSGVALNELGRFQEAVANLELAVGLKSPEEVQARINLAASFTSLKRYRPALDHLDAALALQPSNAQAACKTINLRRILCDWRRGPADLATLTSILRKQLSATTGAAKPSGGASLGKPCLSPGILLHFDLPDHLHREIAHRYSPAADATGVLRLREFADAERARLGVTGPGGRPGGTTRASPSLTVGLVSYDFKNHPMTHILVSLFASLPRREEVRLVAFALNTYTDAWTRRLQDTVDVYLPLGNRTNQVRGATRRPSPTCLASVIPGGGRPGEHLAAKKITN